MKDLKTGVITVKEFINNDYTLIIPDYQRGYRWTKTQIEKLLEDLKAFSDINKDNNTSYSLQPIALIKERDNAYRVIDGQQRLTTIYLILDIYNENINYQKKINPKGKTSWEGLDAKFIENAKNIIKEWEKNDDNKNFKTECLLNASFFVYIFEDTGSGEISFFSKINSDKIPLTNSEMIKAIFVKEMKNETDKKSRILRQWENIENDLQKDNFWLFISNDKDKADTRIDFLFKLLKDNILETKNFTETKNSQFSLFLVYEDYLKKQEDKIQVLEKIWQKIRQYYSTLKYLQKDKECYHLFGYLMSVNEKKAIECLKNLANANKQECKEKIKDKIKEYIEHTLKDLDIKDLSYEKHKNKIRDILLLFNILTANNMEGFRFPFETYKKTEYQVEHIHARNTKLPIERPYINEWFEIINKEDINKDVENFIKDISEKDENEIEKIKEEINKFYNNKKDATNSVKHFALYGYLKEFNENNNPDNKIELKNKDFDDLKKETEQIEENVHLLGNLALLDSTTNQSYGNDYFKQKRDKIIDEDLKGTFILPCTKRIFVNYYTNCNKIWEDMNRTEYISKMKKCLEDFLPKDKENEREKI